MSISDDHKIISGINHWFAKRLNSLPLTQGIDFVDILSDAPFGISTYKVKYSDLTKTNGLKRSGASGWTYFPKSPNGNRLAKVSYQYLPHGPAATSFNVTAVVNLVDYIETDSMLSWTAGGETYVTIDNLVPYGNVEMRPINKPNKRQKLIIKHEQAV